MKKLALILSAVAAVSLMGALTSVDARAYHAVANATVSAGTTNATTVALGSLHGGGEVFVIATGATNRTALVVGLDNTNRVSGGWAKYAEATFTATNAGVYRVSFGGEYLSDVVRLRISSAGAASGVSAFILSN